MMDNLPEASAKECADRYPINETIETLTVTDTALLHQYEVELNYMAQMIDSLLSANCDTVHIEKIKEVIKKIPCKPETKYIIKTQENTAKQQVIIDSCDKKINDLSQINTKNATELQEIKDKNAKLIVCNNWLWIIIILLLMFIFRKQIAKIVL
jgi:ATP-dependent Zn protease